MGGVCTLWKHNIIGKTTMPVYAIYQYSCDMCGNEEITGPARFVQANNEEEVKEVFPERPFSGFVVKEIQIETIAWIKIQRQILG
jgi:hypothetical protein